MEDHNPGGGQNPPGGVQNPELQAFLAALTQAIGPNVPRAGAPDDDNDNYPSARARDDITALNNSVEHLGDGEGLEACRPRLMIPTYSGTSEGPSISEFLQKFMSVAQVANFTNDRRRGAAIMASYLTGPAFKYWETMSPRVKEDYNLICASLLERFKYKSTLDLELDLRQMKYNTDTPLESFVSHYEYIAYELGLPEYSMILCFGDCFPDEIRDKLLEAAPKT